MLEADIDPQSGAFTGGANTLLAVSQTRDPLGPYAIYAIDASHAGCTLCIGDQPLLGADANGVYLSTAEYDLAPPEGSPGFFGAQIYALDKRALAAGDTANVVHFEPGTQFTGTLQPATSPRGRYETAQGGTEYLMSAQDCEPPDCHVDEDSLENTIHVWALTHTASLRSANPNLRLLTARSRARGLRPADPPAPEAGDPPEEEGNGANCRWGDYSASFALPTGEIWSATEFIGDNARTTFANWSTFVWPSRP